MKKSCTTCSPCNKFTIWVALPLLVVMAILFIASSQNVFAEVGVNIPNEAAEPSCAESGSCFLPTDATVGVGDTVTWTNDSSVIHTVTSGNPDGKAALNTTRRLRQCRHCGLRALADLIQ